MPLTYFKRYRMAYDLHRELPDGGSLPDNYELRPWQPSLLDDHADAKYRSFCFELDANVFPCLGEREGCRRLMSEISGRANFLPSATWLLVCTEGFDGPEACGTIQGIQDGEQSGAIQNLGITPDHRGFGLGTYLLVESLRGFQQRGLRRACLEVTARNNGALKLYERLGFNRVKTVYKAAEVALV
jgi:[ribosomal protein S18]-alanine N-acetyltransferase